MKRLTDDILVTLLNQLREYGISVTQMDATPEAIGYLWQSRERHFNGSGMECPKPAFFEGIPITERKA